MQFFVCWALVTSATDDWEKVLLMLNIAETLMYFFPQTLQGSDHTWRNLEYLEKEGYLCKAREIL